MLVKFYKFATILKLKQIYINIILRFFIYICRIIIKMLKDLDLTMNYTLPIALRRPKKIIIKQ